MIKVPIDKTITELQIILPLYMILSLIYWRFRNSNEDDGR